MSALLQSANDFAVNLADSPWVYLVVLAFAALDALIPMVPSESVVVALAALGASGGDPNLLLLGACAAIGAFLGDNTTFWIGRTIGLDRFAWQRRPRFRKAFTWAGEELSRRAAILIFTARYIPVGRVAVNLTAGATGFSYRRFLPLSIASTVTWATYAVVIGTVAGHWIKDHALYGAMIAVVIALVLGVCIDRLLTMLQRRRAAQS